MPSPDCLPGLLSVTGQRIGEAIRLKAKDIDLQAGVLTIRDTKFGKSRLVPPSTGVVLEQYPELMRLAVARLEQRWGDLP